MAPNFCAMLKLNASKHVSTNKYCGGDGDDASAGAIYTLQPRKVLKCV